MEIVKLVGVGIATAIAYILVKQVKSEFAIFIALGGSIILLIMIIGQVSGVLEYMNEVIQKTGIDTGVYHTILKIIGVGYLTEFAANLCSDSGTASIGNKIILGGKIVILCLALPIITTLLDIIISLLP